MGGEAEEGPQIVTVDPRHLRRYGLLAGYFFLSLYVMTVFTIGQGFGLGIDRVERIMHGGAPRPVPYRMLVPTLSRIGIALVPGSVEERMRPLLISIRDSEPGRLIVAQRYKGEGHPPNLQDERIVETAVVTVIIYAFLLAFIAMLHRLAREVIPGSPAFAATAPLVALFWLPVFCANWAYSYDFAELFFSCACIFLLHRRQWLAYLVTFGLATVNKETSLFLLVFYLAWMWGRLPVRRYLQLGAAQLVVYAAIKGAITLHFADVPGEIMATAHSRQLAHMLGAYGFESAVAMIVVVCLTTWKWRTKPEFLRTGLWMLVPNGLAYFAGSNPGEYRSFYWSLPVVILLVTHTLVGAAGFLERSSADRA
ncbi:MAG TPA: hypothetical protein VN700_10780 [Vicinamibacterales bacterium]|nr:hypothetical protein [Vicinamibacterales bacterium]